MFDLISWAFAIGFLIPCFSKTYRGTAIVLFLFAALNVADAEFLSSLAFTGSNNVYVYTCMADVVTISMLFAFGTKTKYYQIGLLFSAVMINVASLQNLLGVDMFVNLITGINILQLLLLRGGIYEFVGSLRREQPRKLSFSRADDFSSNIKYIPWSDNRQVRSKMVSKPFQKEIK